MVRAVATAAEIAAQRDTEAREAAAKGQAREAQARAATIEQQLAQEQRRFYLQLRPRDGIVVGRNPAQAGVVLDHPEASREHFRLASTGRGPGRAVKPTRREISIFSVSAIDLFVARASGGRFVRADENASLSVTILRAIFDRLRPPIETCSLGSSDETQRPSDRYLRFERPPSADVAAARHGTACIVMEWLDRLLDGLAHVHDHDYLHQDIKPANIVIRAADDEPVLIDFGAARVASQRRTRLRVAGGTRGRRRRDVAEGHRRRTGVAV